MIKGYHFPKHSFIYINIKDCAIFTAVVDSFRRMIKELMFMCCTKKEI